MTTILETDPKPDSPEWWNRQLTYLMNESFHALRMADQKRRELQNSDSNIPYQDITLTISLIEDWIERAEYLRGMVHKCVENAYESIQLQIEEDKQNE